MIFLRARSYDTSLGRFTTRDPASLSPMQPVNPYAYAGNDPVNVTDPSGACFLPVGCGELHHIASGFDTARHEAAHLGDIARHDLAHVGDVARHDAAHVGDVARHDAAHYADVVIHEIATHPLLDVIVGAVAALAVALLAPEVILAALAVIAEIGEIVLEILEVIELVLQIMALLRLIHILGKVATGRPPKPYRVLLQAQGPTRGNRDRNAVQESEPLEENSPITVKEGLRGLTVLARKLTEQQYKERKKPFFDAVQWIRSLPPKGSAPPGKSFPVHPRNPIRVDVVINAGVNFVR
jgi:hypothetical protein